MTNEIWHGVWGGLTGNQRYTLAKKTRREQRTKGIVWYMDKIDNFELEYWQTRVDDMQVIIDSLRTERDNALDAANSLHQELEQIKSYVKQSESIISRLRNHIAQGVELWQLSAINAVQSFQAIQNEYRVAYATQIVHAGSQLQQRVDY